MRARFVIHNFPYLLYLSVSLSALPALIEFRKTFWQSSCRAIWHHNSSLVFFSNILVDSFPQWDIFLRCVSPQSFCKQILCKAPCYVLNCINKFIAFVYRLDNIFNCGEVGSKPQDTHWDKLAGSSQHTPTQATICLGGDGRGEAWDCGGAGKWATAWQKCQIGRQKQQRRVTKFKWMTGIEWISKEWKWLSVSVSDREKMIGRMPHWQCIDARLISLLVLLTYTILLYLYTHT